MTTSEWKKALRMTGSALLVLTTVAVGPALAQPAAAGSPEAQAQRQARMRANRVLRTEQVQARRMAMFEATARLQGQRAQRALLRGVDLDESQRAKLREMGQKRQAEMRELSARLREARQAMRQARAAETIDEAAIRQHATAVATAEADLAIARAHARTEMLSVLTPDQLKIVKERQQRMLERQKRVRERAEQMRQRMQQRLQELRKQRQW